MGFFSISEILRSKGQRSPHDLIQAKLKDQKSWTEIAHYKVGILGASVWPRHTESTCRQRDSIKFYLVLQEFIAPITKMYISIVFQYFIIIQCDMSFCTPNDLFMIINNQWSTKCYTHLRRTILPLSFVKCHIFPGFCW